MLRKIFFRNGEKMFYILIIKNQFNKSILALPLFYFFKSPFQNKIRPFQAKKKPFQNKICSFQAKKNPFQNKIRPFQGKIRPTYYREYYREL
ncbi:hypothetical protein PTM39_15030, partial [Clostridium perfringens]|nr:hypothetical protein [Clostridium perfringens]MDJ9057836.1 hypothetical protein [Clostridium perfringens]